MVKTVEKIDNGTVTITKNDYPHGFADYMVNSWEHSLVFVEGLGKVEPTKKVVIDNAKEIQFRGHEHGDECDIINHIFVKTE